MYPTSAYTFNITHGNYHQHKAALDERLADCDTPIGNLEVALDTAIRAFEQQLTEEWIKARAKDMELAIAEMSK